MTPDLDDLDIFERQTSRKLTRTTLAGDVTDSISRYEDMLAGGRTGVMTPFTRLNEITGGLEARQPDRGGSSLRRIQDDLRPQHCEARGDDRTGGSLLSRNDPGGGDGHHVLDDLGIDRNHFNTGKFSKEEMDGISFRRGEVERIKLAIFDDAFVGVDEVRADCLSLSCDEPLGLIVVDYIQLMAIHGFRGNREQEIAQISHGLKAIANESKCPLIALSQLNEDGYLRESRAIGHDANIVLLLEEGIDSITVKIDKGRTMKNEFRLLCHRRLLPDSKCLKEESALKMRGSSTSFPSTCNPSCVTTNATAC